MSARGPRVLMLATRVPLRSGDGTPSFVLDHAIALADRFEITVLAPRMLGVGGVTEVSGVTVRRFAYLPRRWERLADDAIMPQIRRRRLLWLQAVPLTVAMLLAAFREHRRSRPDVVHAHWIVPAGLAAALLRVVFGTPYLITSHGADAFLLDSGPLRTLKRWIVRQSSAFVGVSQEIVTKYAASARRAVLQPVGADFDGWARLVGDRRPIRGRILFVGRLDAKKGVGVAIRALAAVPGSHLRVVGDGPEREPLEALAASLGVAGRVEFVGRMPKERIGGEMREAACVVIPSVIAPGGDRDGTPTVLAEAIAAGIPIVAARIAGIADHVVDGTHGHLHHPGDAQDLARRLTQALDDPDAAARLAEQARSDLRDTLDTGVARSRYESLYHVILAGEG